MLGLGASCQGSWRLGTACFPTMPINGLFLRRCKQGALQFVMIKPVLAVLTVAPPPPTFLFPMPTSSLPAPPAASSLPRPVVGIESLLLSLYLSCYLYLCMCPLSRRRFWHVHRLVGITPSSVPFSERLMALSTSLTCKTADLRTQTLARATSQRLPPARQMSLFDVRVQRMLMQNTFFWWEACGATRIRALSAHLSSS